MWRRRYLMRLAVTALVLVAIVLVAVLARADPPRMRTTRDDTVLGTLAGVAWDTPRECGEGLRTCRGFLVTSALGFFGTLLRRDLVQAAKAPSSLQSRVFPTAYQENGAIVLVLRGTF